MKDFNAVDREWHNLAKTIKDSIFIRVNNPTFNRNIGKYRLTHIRDKGLFNTKEPKAKSKQEQEHQVHKTTLVPSMTKCLAENTISHRPDKSILAKACLQVSYFLFLMRTNKSLCLLHERNLVLFW